MEAFTGKDFPSNKKFFYPALAGVILAVVVIGGLFLMHRYSVSDRPPVFSKRNMIEALWFHYKKENLETSTMRTLDHERDNITTSEGESYTMFRAVWMDDKPTFDASLQWTKDNIQHKDDHLFSWHFGKRADGSYGILTEDGGQNSAADADEDIALSLLFASSKWNQNSYFGDSILIIRDIWAKEVVTINGKPYIVANDVEKFDATKSYYLINPSYYAPYAYKIFSTVDPDHDWAGVASTSYEVLNDNLDKPLSSGSSAGLPSDWLAIDRVTGQISKVPNDEELTTNYSYDSLRVPFRLALDSIWFKDPRAAATLQKMSFLKDQWNKKQMLNSIYSHSGSVINATESAAMYGGSIGYFMIADPSQAENVYLQKIEALYDTDTFNWKQYQGYYNANMAWFGMALYAGLTPNLYVDHMPQQTP